MHRSRFNDVREKKIEISKISVIILKDSSLSCIPLIPWKNQLTNRININELNKVSNKVFLFINLNFLL